PPRAGDRARCGAVRQRPRQGAGQARQGGLQPPGVHPDLHLRPRRHPRDPVGRPLTKNMDRYCVMGNPVEHSKSPWIHARFAELTGEPIEYGRRLAPLDGFERSVREWIAEDGEGCNVTLPYKFEARALADEASPRARLAGA